MRFLPSSSTSSGRGPPSLHRADVNGFLLEGPPQVENVNNWDCCIVLFTIINKKKNIIVVYVRVGGVILFRLLFVLMQDLRFFSAFHVQLFLNF